MGKWPKVTSVQRILVPQYRKDSEPDNKSQERGLTNYLASTDHPQPNMQRDLTKAKVIGPVIRGLRRATQYVGEALSYIGRSL